MERDAMLVVRLPSKVKQALHRAADEDGRSMSNLATRIVTLWLEKEGFLRAQARPRRGERE